MTERDYARHLDDMALRDWERTAERLEATQKAIAKHLEKLEKITAMQKGNESAKVSKKTDDSQAQPHKHFSELRIAGRVDGVVRCKEFFRFCVAVKTDLHPLDGEPRNNYFCIYLEGKAFKEFLGGIYKGDYISLRVKIRAYLGWGEPFGNPMSAWSSPVHLYVDDPAQIIYHEVCGENDKDEIGEVPDEKGE